VLPPQWAAFVVSDLNVVLTVAEWLSRLKAIVAKVESLMRRRIFLSKSAEQLEAVGSAESRKYLFFRSLRMTAENPIFGVGPGQFMTGEAKMSKEQGVRASWHVSHNSYTEVSSEMGIPGLLLYLAVLVSAYRELVGLRKRGLNVQIRRTALSMQIALSMMLVGAIFLSMAYGGVFDPGFVNRAASGSPKGSDDGSLQLEDLVCPSHKRQSKDSARTRCPRNRIEPRWISPDCARYNLPPSIS
jgi:O-antigen ligase